MKLSNVFIMNLLALLAASCSFGVVAEEVIPTGCAAKLAAISQEMDQAKQAGNTYQLKGLQTAYENVLAHCDDNALRLERLENIQQKEAKVAERNAELAEAIADGKSADKVMKKRTKLAQAEAELTKARAELDK